MLEIKCLMSYLIRYVNGAIVGEIGMEFAIAGDFGVPTWLVACDSAGMAEAEEILSGLKTVIVKKALGEFEALCYTPRKTTKLPYEASKSIINTPLDVKPLTFKGPIKLEIELTNSDYLKKLKEQYPDIIYNENKVSLENDTITGAWSRYCRIKKIESN